MSKLATLLKFQSDVPDHQVDSSNKALVMGADQPKIITAEVSSTDNSSVLLHGYETLPATTAASCLFLPEIGDQVSAIIERQKIYITAILYRAIPDSPLVMNSGDIPLHLVTTSLEIHSPERVEIHTRHFSLMARTSLWVAKTMHQVADSLFVRAKQASKEVENTDMTHARHINQQADQSLIINSRIGSLNASSVLKIDGGQVHMG
ncbi:DUF3540 domain-containing protein [Yersinia sp. LJYL362]|uniref:DUF3540 domain-containing protein n=1 Tax=Yersinia sp. LJYL362 TaxID=3402108 RepID=UPI003AB5B6C4